MRVRNCYPRLFSQSLRNIGGNLGIGIVAYFLFIKWLLFLNVLLFAIVFLALVLPTIIFEIPEREYSDLNDTRDVAYFSELYDNVSETHWNNDIMDFLQGRGFLERTLLFYGAYSHDWYPGTVKSMPLAYILAMIAIFLISLLAIVRSAAQGFRERIAESEGQFYQYCNLVFSGWDFCINNEKAAATKHRALYNELKSVLESERLKDERQNRTREEKLKLYSIRAIVNAFIMAALACYALVLHYVIDFSFERVTSRNASRNNEEELDYISLHTLGQALFEFLPYVFIVFLNMLVPFLFRYLVSLEHYGPSCAPKITLFRSIKLRFVSIVVLLVGLYRTVVPEDEDSRPLCWETFVGQQFFKFYLTDFALQLYVTFFVNFPRSLIAHNAENKVLKFVGEQTFDMPRHVLDIAYSQTICWLGCFFAPLLPLVAGVGFFLLFYIKKFACLVNSKPVNKVYHASRSGSYFMLVLLISYSIAIVPVAYCVVKIEPSKSCGPFRDLESVWALLIETYLRVPSMLRVVAEYASTATFAVPLFVILGLLLYYYRTVYVANKEMVAMLKNQLVLEGHDKQFLLNRLSAFIKQQQDQTKCHPEGNDLDAFS